MNERERARIVDALGSAIADGEQSLGQVPGLLCKILKEGAWQDFQTRLGEPVHHDRFEDFVIAPPLTGLGASITDIRRIVGNDPVVLDLLDQAMGSHQGQRTNFVNNINEVERPQGTSSARALRHLREKRPELHQRVLNKELSPHAAMVEAGFRPHTMTVNIDNPKSAASLVAKASPAFLEELKKLLDMN